MHSVYEKKKKHPVFAVPDWIKFYITQPHHIWWENTSQRSRSKTSPPSWKLWSRKQVTCILCMYVINKCLLFKIFVLCWNAVENMPKLFYTLRWRWKKISVYLDRTMSSWLVEHQNDSQSQILKFLPSHPSLGQSPSSSSCQAFLSVTICYSYFHVHPISFSSLISPCQCVCHVYFRYKTSYLFCQQIF